MSRKPPTNRRRRPRVPGLFRFGERKRPDMQAERTRLTLFLTNYHLDLAESLLASAGFATIQKYCEALLEEALDAERSRLTLTETEAERGPLEGLREIADDPEYLAEWNASMNAARSGSHEGDGIVIEVVPAQSPYTPPVPVLRVLNVPEPASSAAMSTVLKQIQTGPSSGGSFLGSLRRGEVPLPEDVAELVEALAALDTELTSAQAVDRRLAYALHRLAFESQILLTDAWPGAFDAETVHTVRAIQEAVDRILSGEDIRYLDA